MKKCASCTKDLPEAALHCVFCGAKQPPAPAVQPGLAKTAFGYSNEMMDQLRQSGGQAPRPHPASQPPPNYGQPPLQQPPYPPPQQGYAPTAPAAANAATVFVSGPPPGQPNAASFPTQRHPPSQPPPMGYQPPAQNYHPPSQPPPMQNYHPPSQPPPYGAPQGYNPQMQGLGVHSPNQITPQPLPNVSPYGAPRAAAPIEPWKDSLPFMLIVWGVALLVAFATPIATEKLTFYWNFIIDGPNEGRIVFLTVGAAAVLGIVFGAIPLEPLPRGILATVLGLAPVIVPFAVTKFPEWQVLVQLAGFVLLIPALLVRNEYTESSLSRMLVTAGVIAVLVPYLIPVHDEIPLVMIFKGLIHAPGEAKVIFILEIVKIALVVLTLLVWMPGPATGGAKLFAWALILYPVGVYFIDMLLKGHVVDLIKASPAALDSWLIGVGGQGDMALGVTFAVFIGYGLATVIGKQLE